MSTALAFIVDLVLALMLVGLAWATVETRDVRRGVALFIAFGLLLALVWARLAAPDLALAEAAIGAGIAGALLLAALRGRPASMSPGPRPAAWRRWLVGAGSAALAVFIAWGLLDAFATGDDLRLAGYVFGQLDRSGVSNPVTAVLLNFRAYDTLLELAVILTAVLGILALARARPGYRPAGLILYGLARNLVPLLVLVAGYLLWVGAHAPGGAFQAGAVLAAAAVLVRLAGYEDAGLPAVRLLRWVLVSGVGVFLGVGLLVGVAGLAVLQYPPAWAGSLILLIETAATLSIAAGLALAFVGGRPAGWYEPEAPDGGGKGEGRR